MATAVENQSTEQSMRELLLMELLQILNDDTNIDAAINKILLSIKQKTGFDAVGIRLKKDTDFPYFVQNGFSKDFLLTENSLIEKSKDGGVCRDKNGNVILECTCGLVLCGKTDPSNTLFTENGSFWTNNSLPFLDIPLEQDPRHNPRNKCIHEGYMSIALIPIRNNDEIVGLLQLNDHRRNCFTIEMIQFFEGVSASIGIALMQFQKVEALRKSREEFHSYFETGSIGMAVTSPEKEWLEVNDHLCLMLGYTKKELSHLTWTELTHPDDLNLDLELFNQVLAGKRNRYELEKKFIRKDGSTVYTILSVSCQRNADGTVNKILASLINVTEKQKMQEIIQRSAKLDSLGILAGGIAHDFNNLLAGIFGYIDLAALKTTEPQVYEYLEKSLSTIERARGLTQQLLTFSKGGAPVKKTESLFPFLKETASFALSGSSVSCNFDYPENLWACSFDKNQIGQVIENIIINAQQSMPAGGTIEFSARNISLAEKEHPVLLKGNYVKMSIKDSGIGMPKELLLQIFDPFFTTKPKGHGLGLATCYSIINRHGGSIDVESEPSKGSTFHVYIPASSESIMSSTENKYLQQKAKGTIMVMDDDEIVNDVVSAMLESFGYSVVCKTNGKDAVDFFTAEIKANRKITAMIFDLTIPGGMGGKEAVTEIRKMDTEIPVFVASGYASDPVMANPAKYGFTASICKPFKIADLAEMLETHLPHVNI